MITADLVYLTRGEEGTTEEHITYIAKVSNPSLEAQKLPSPRLIKTCIREGHWSVFEHAHMTIEINCPMWLATQILRHRSFKFQQFSARYSKVNPEMFLQEARAPHPTNRQKSEDTFSDEFKEQWEEVQVNAAHNALRAYDWAIENGIAKECARNILPVGTMTRMYMTGDIRSWIHYIQLRTGNGTQQEHIDLANKIKEVFVENLPTISEALEWK
tara:strand:+ start:6807 stop:7451 length:645 start_codon:yes stop_codon:yes gene_type:complete